jgi:hypothetical protein
MAGAAMHSMKIISMRLSFETGPSVIDPNFRSSTRTSVGNIEMYPAFESPSH